MSYNQNEQLRAVGRALAAGDTWTAGVLARDLAAGCDGEGVLAPYASIRTLLDGVAGLHPDRGPAALDLPRLADLSLGGMSDALRAAGLEIETRGVPGGRGTILAMASWADGHPGRAEYTSGSLTHAIAGAVRALLMARHPAED